MILTVDAKSLFQWIFAVTDNDFFIVSINRRVIFNTQQIKHIYGILDEYTVPDSFSI